MPAVTMSMTMEVVAAAAVVVAAAGRRTEEDGGGRGHTFSNASPFRTKRLWVHIVRCLA